MTSFGRVDRPLHKAAYSTVVVTPGTNELNAFGYGIGGCVSGSRVAVATIRETNLRCANQFVDDGSEWVGLSWAIPTVIPAHLTWTGASYHVTQADIEDFLMKSAVQLYIGWDRPVLELVPGHHPVHRDEAGWRQKVPLPGPLPAGRLEKFWLTLTFLPGCVKLWQPDSSLAVTFRLTPKVEGVEVIGKREDLENPKEKLYVAVGKAGLEQLLEDLLWWKPEEKP